MVFPLEPECVVLTFRTGNSRTAQVANGPFAVVQRSFSSKADVGNAFSLLGRFVKSSCRYSVGNRLMSESLLLVPALDKFQAAIDSWLAPKRIVVSLTFDVNFGEE